MLSGVSVLCQIWVSLAVVRQSCFLTLVCCPLMLPAPDVAAYRVFLKTGFGALPAIRSNAFSTAVAIQRCGLPQWWLLNHSLRRENPFYIVFGNLKWT
jgi:hypothetical protein